MPASPVLPGATVGIVLAAAATRRRPGGGDPIDGIEAARATGALVFHAGHGGAPARTATSRPNGGRVLTVVGRGPGPRGARAAVAEAAADAISWPGMQRRHDIAAEPPGARSCRRESRR